MRNLKYRLDWLFVVCGYPIAIVLTCVVTYCAVLVLAIAVWAPREAYCAAKAFVKARKGRE